MPRLTKLIVAFFGFLLVVLLFAVSGRAVLSPPLLIEKELVLSILARILIVVALVAAWRSDWPPLRDRRDDTDRSTTGVVVALGLLTVVLLQKGDVYLHYPAGRVALFAGCMIAVAVAEELFFRRILFSSLIQVYGRVYLAATLSSALFGLAHLFAAAVITDHPPIYVLSQLIFTFCLGVFFCGLYYRSGSLAAVSLVHAVGNIVLGTNRLSGSVLLGSAEMEATATPVGTATLVPTLLLYAGLALTGYYQLHRQRNQ